MTCSADVCVLGTHPKIHVNVTHGLSEKSEPRTIWAIFPDIVLLVSVQTGQGRFVRGLPYKQNNSHFSFMSAMIVSSLGNTRRRTPVGSGISCKKEAGLVKITVIVSHK